jgi:hypothetical protein
MNKQQLRRIVLEEIFDLYQEDRDYDIDSLPFTLSLMELYTPPTDAEREAMIKKRATELNKKKKTKVANLRPLATQQVDAEIAAEKAASDEIDAARADDESTRAEADAARLEYLENLPNGEEGETPVPADASAEAPDVTPDDGTEDKPGIVASLIGKITSGAAEEEKRREEAEAAGGSKPAADGSKPAEAEPVSEPEGSSATPEAPATGDAPGSPAEGEMEPLPSDSSDSEGAAPSTEGEFSDEVDRKIEDFEARMKVASGGEPEVTAEGTYWRRGLVNLLYSN